MTQDGSSSREDAADRRQFLTTSTIGMAGGLLASYGYFGYMAGNFMYPAKPTETILQFVADVKSVTPGDAITFKTPAGADVTITRQGDADTAESFLALSSTCPHLGCSVHWESQNNRFFCPCHNGVFDSRGKATEGPPADAGQSLPSYPLRVVAGLLFIEVPVAILAKECSRKRESDSIPESGTTLRPGAAPETNSTPKPGNAPGRIA